MHNYPSYLPRNHTLPAPLVPSYPLLRTDTLQVKHQYVPDNRDIGAVPILLLFAPDSMLSYWYIPF